MTNYNNVKAIPAPLLLAVAAGPPVEALVELALDATVDGTVRTFLRGLVPTVRRRLLDLLRTEHATEFARAKAWLADRLADETLDIADDRSIPTDRARLQIEARWRRCAALHPDVYGDRKQVEHSGAVELRLIAAERAAAGPAGPGAPATRDCPRSTAGHSATSR